MRNDIYCLVFGRIPSKSGCEKQFFTNRICCVYNNNIIIYLLKHKIKSYFIVLNDSMK